MIARLLGFLEFVMNAIFGVFKKALFWVFIAFAVGVTFATTMFYLGYAIAK